MKDHTLCGYRFNTPVSTVESLAAVGAVTGIRVGLNGEIDILPQAAVSVPTMMHTGAVRGGDPRVEIERTGLGHVRRWRTLPLTAGGGKTFAE